MCSKFLPPEQSRNALMFVTVGGFTQAVIRSLGLRDCSGPSGTLRQTCFETQKLARGLDIRNRDCANDIELKMSGESLQLRGEVPTSKRSDVQHARTNEDVVTWDGFLSGYINVRGRCPDLLLP